MSQVSNLTKYKKAVKAAHRYHEPAARVYPYKERKQDKHEEKWNELFDKAVAIEETLTEDEEEKAIEWLAANSLYGYHDDVC